MSWLKDHYSTLTKDTFMFKLTATYSNNVAIIQMYSSRTQYYTGFAVMKSILLTFLMLLF